MGQRGKHLLRGILVFLPNANEKKASNEPARKVTQNSELIRLKAVFLINITRS